MTERKGIVIKAQGEKVYILTDDGEFATVKASGAVPAPGDEFSGEYLSAKPAPMGKFRWIASAAAILFVFLIGGGAFAYNIPFSTKTLSTDPGVELKTNMFKQVISVSSQDKDVDEQLNNLDLKSPELEKNVQSIINNAKSKAAEHRNTQNQGKFNQNPDSESPAEEKGTGSSLKGKDDNNQGTKTADQGKENSEDRNGNE